MKQPNQFMISKQEINIFSYLLDYNEIELNMRLIVGCNNKQRYLII